MTGFRTIFGIDLRTLAAFRVGLGLLLLADLFNRSTALTAHYSDSGVLPFGTAMGLLDDWRISIHSANGSVLFQSVLFMIAALFAFSVLVGYRTRITTIISWALLLSLHNRNPMVLQGGDRLLLLLLFWAMFMPLGARFSVDATLDSSGETHPNEYFAVANIALKIQCMSVYFFGALLKTGSQWIPDGTAIYYTLHIDQFATPFAVWFRQFPLIMQVLTYYVWHLQLVGPILMFSPIFHTSLRLLVLCCFATMHIGFVLFLEIGLFPYISLVSLIAFMPTGLWDKVGMRMQKSERLALTIYYDQDCGFCNRMGRLLRTFLLSNETAVVPAQNKPHIYGMMERHDSWVVVEDHQGRQYLGWQALCAVFRSSFLCWPVAYFFSSGCITLLRNQLYNKIYANRRCLGQVTARFISYRPVTVNPTFTSSVIVALLMFYVFYWNVTTLEQYPYSFPKELIPVGKVLRLDQYWGMFAPHPLIDDGWYTIPGRLVDGIGVDVYKQEIGTPTWEKPKYVSTTYPNYRWRKYLMRIWHKVDKTHYSHYARYLCKTWNDHAAKDRQLQELKIYFNLERTLPKYREPAVEKVLILAHTCKS